VTRYMSAMEAKADTPAQQLAAEEVQTCQGLDKKLASNKG